MCLCPAVIIQVILCPITVTLWWARFLQSKLYIWKLIVTNHIFLMYVTDCTFLNKILWILESLNDGVSNHQPHHCLLNRLFGCRSKKTSQLRVIGLCALNSPGEFAAQMVSNAENASIWWRHHVKIGWKIISDCVTLALLGTTLDIIAYWKKKSTRDTFFYLQIC